MAELCHLSLGGQVDILVWEAYGRDVYDVGWKRKSKRTVVAGPAMKLCVVLSMVTG